MTEPDTYVPAGYQWSANGRFFRELNGRQLRRIRHFFAQFQTPTIHPEASAGRAYSLEELDRHVYPRWWYPGSQPWYRSFPR